MLLTYKVPRIPSPFVERGGQVLPGDVAEPYQPPGGQRHPHHRPVRHRHLLRLPDHHHAQRMLFGLRDHGNIYQEEGDNIGNH